jgi:hypothetical protein
MRWLEVRRHSLTKKGSARGRGSHLSAEGVALARAVGESLGPFAAVVTSASPRATETALAMGFAVDDAVELPSGYVPGEVDHREQWGWPHPYRIYAELLGRGGGLATVAEAHRCIWTRVVEAVPDGAAALVVAHGGGSSRGWWPACRTPATSRGVRRWATVTAPGSASTRAGSSASSSIECRWSCCPEAPTSAGGERRSFCWSFHLALLGPTGPHWLDDPSDLSCHDSTRQTIRGCLVNSRLGVRVPPPAPISAGHRLEQARSCALPARNPSSRRTTRVVDAYQPEAAMCCQLALRISTLGR